MISDASVGRGVVIVVLEKPKQTLQNGTTFWTVKIAQEVVPFNKAGKFWRGKNRSGNFATLISIFTVIYAVDDFSIGEEGNGFVHGGSHRTTRQVTVTWVHS